MAAIDWCAEVMSWTHFLRDYGFRLTLGDDLRIATLVERLRQESVTIEDAESAARWFSPVVCRTADEQMRLPGLMGAWAKLRLPERRVPEALAPPVAAAVREVTRERSRARRRWWWFAAAAPVVVLGLLFFLSRLHPEPSSTTKPQPTASAPAQRETTQPTTWPQVSDRVIAGILTLLPFGLLMIVLQRRRQEAAALLRGLVPRDAPAMALQIKLVDLNLFRPQAVKGAVADFRRHRLVPADWIDAPRSVAATVAAAGRVQLVRAMRPTLPEHLLLVDLAGTDDILSTLAELIVTRLREGDVKVERFDYQGDPRRLRRIDEHGVVTGSVELEALRGLCPDHRLIILSDATSMSQSSGERMRSWVDQLRSWSDVALITPLPAAQWGPRERALVRLGFRVVEATPRGIGELARQFRAELPQERGTPGGAFPPKLDRVFAADPYRWLSDRSPSASEIAGLIAEMKAVLGPRAFLYLAALAVFPAVHPKLILALGRVLSDAEAQPLLSEETLALLCRVPWLRRGRIPDWLRLALVRDLRALPEESERVRAAWTALLAPQVEGEATTLPIEVVRSSNPGLAQLVSGLLKERESYREAILLAFLNREALPELAMELPQRLAATLRDGVPRFIYVLPFVGVATALFVAAFLRTINNGVNLMEALLPSPLILFDTYALFLLGLLLGFSALALWYMRIFAGRLSRRGAWKLLSEIPRALPIGAAVGSFSVLLGSSLFADHDATRLAAVLLAALFVALCCETHDQGALGWVPLLTLTQLSYQAASLNLIVLPLTAWLATRYTWPQMRQAFCYAAPAYVFRFHVGSGLTLGGDGGTLLALVLLARLLSDHDYRRRALEPTTISYREIMVLFFPLATWASLAFWKSITLSWDPELAYFLVWFVLGFIHGRSWRLLALLFCVALLLTAADATGVLPTLAGVYKIFSFVSGPLLAIPYALVTTLVIFASGRLLRVAVNSHGKFITPQLTLLVFVSLIGSIIGVKLPTSQGYIPTALCAAVAPMVTAATAGVLLSRRALWRCIGFGLTVALLITFGDAFVQSGRIWPVNLWSRLDTTYFGFLYILPPLNGIITLLAAVPLSAWVAHRMAPLAATSSKAAASDMMRAA